MPGDVVRRLIAGKDTQRGDKRNSLLINLYLMCGSSHFDRASNDEFSVEF